jgi:type II secretory pathway component GspD/PulD (secretin)
MIKSRAYRIVLLTLMFPVATFAVDDAPKPQQKQEESVEARLAKPLPEINFEKISFADVVDFLRDVTGLNLVVDAPAIKTAAGVTAKTSVSYRARDVKTSKALEQILKSVEQKEGQLALGTAGNVVVISTPAALKALQAQFAADAKKSSKDNDPAKLERTLPEVRFDAVKLSDVVDFLRDITGSNIFVNWNAMQQVGIKKDVPISLRLREVPFREALRLIINEAAAGKAELDYHVDQNVITIEPRKAAL